MTDAPQKSPGYYKVITLYVALLIAIVFQFPLNTSLPIISFFLFFILMAAIGFLRREADKDSHIYNHATFLSRTLWLSSFMILLCIIAAGIYVNDTVTIGLEEIQVLSQDMRSGNMDSPLIVQLLPIAIATAAPGMLYLIWRYIAGFVAALKGRSPKRPKSFF